METKWPDIHPVHAKMRAERFDGMAFMSQNEVIILAIAGAPALEVCYDRAG